MDELQKNNAINQINGLSDALNDAKEYSSILKMDSYDATLLRAFVSEVDDNGQVSLMSFSANQSKKGIINLIDICETLMQKYDTVVTNPPYMGSGGMSSKLTMYVKGNYPYSKGDLSTIMM